MMLAKAKFRKYNSLNPSENTGKQDIFFMCSVGIKRGH